MLPTYNGNRTHAKGVDSNSVFALGDSPNPLMQGYAPVPVYQSQVPAFTIGICRMEDCSSSSMVKDPRTHFTACTECGTVQDRCSPLCAEQAMRNHTNDQGETKDNSHASITGGAKRARTSNTMVPSKYAQAERAVNNTAPLSKSDAMHKTIVDNIHAVENMPMTIQFVTMTEDVVKGAKALAGTLVTNLDNHDAFCMHKDSDYHCEYKDVFNSLKSLKLVALSLLQIATGNMSTSWDRDQIREMVRAIEAEGAAYNRVYKTIDKLVTRDKFECDVLIKLNEMEDSHKTKTTTELEKKVQKCTKQIEILCKALGTGFGMVHILVGRVAKWEHSIMHVDEKVVATIAYLQEAKKCNLNMSVENVCKTMKDQAWPAPTTIKTQIKKGTLVDVSI